ncbi:MAG: hypothetical protein ACYCS1_10200 [Gammaproteobacteria bacterium]
MGNMQGAGKGRITSPPGINSGNEEGDGVVSLLQRYETVREELEQVINERESLRLEIEKLKNQICKENNPLTQLEGLLAQPDRGFGVVVYYRLRAVWGLCNQKLLTLSKELQKRLEGTDRESFRQQAMTLNAAKRQGLEAKIALLQAERQAVNKILTRLQHEARPARFLKRLTTQNVEPTILAEKTKLRVLERDIEALSRESEKLAKDLTEGYPGLSLPVRREINCAILALAQHLYLAFNEGNICDFALMAKQKALIEINFGSLIECQNIDRKIRELLIRFRNQTQKPDDLKKRTAWLKARMIYRDAQDALPDTECLNFIDTAFDDTTIRQQAFYQPIPVNVLALNFWNVRDALCNRSPEND